MTRITVTYDGFFVGTSRLYRDVLTLNSPTLANVIEVMTEKLGPRFRSTLIAAGTGEISDQVAVLVNGRRLPLHTPLQEEDEVAILFPIAGG